MEESSESFENVHSFELLKECLFLMVLFKIGCLIFDDFL